MNEFLHKIKDFYYLYMTKKAKLLSLLSFTFSSKTKTKLDIFTSIPSYVSQHCLCRLGLLDWLGDWIR